MENNNQIKNTRNNSSSWKMISMFLLGVIVGFLFAPIKKGMRICCDNTDSMNAYNNECNSDDEDFDEGIPF